MYVNGNCGIYFENFGVENILKAIKTNIFIIQAYDSIMCGYFCTGFINFTAKPLYSGHPLIAVTSLQWELFSGKDKLTAKLS